MSDKSVFSEEKEQGFRNPTQLPGSPEEQEEWLKRNKEWWEKNPMRYDWKETIAPEEFSVGFYQEIDRRSVSSMSPTIPYDRIPFDRLVPFASLKGKRVLEIGVGNGGHAQLLAMHSDKFTGIDLTNYGVKSTSKRMELMGLKNANIWQMNAEQLKFPDNEFDFVWSWGVIHHSANTRQILSEIFRVMKPGGEFRGMVYNRGYWNYYVNGFLGGLFKGQLGKGIHRVVQNNTDGAIARFYGTDEWRRELEQKGFIVSRVFTMGLKAEILPLPGGRVKCFLLKLMPDRLSYWLTHQGGMGSFLVFLASKPQ
jgi:ubiquinone/menaquinone biosynthesis C-methylase UbiE